MTEKPIHKKSNLFNHALLLIVILSFIIWSVRLYPRTGWSLSEDTKLSATEGSIIPRLSSDKIKNVVLISIDTCRADHLGCYNYSRNTSPNIDALAAEGVLFNHAITSVPITLASHSSMITGKIPPSHKVRDNNDYRLDESNTTLAEILHSEGYITAAFVSAFVLDSQFGLNQGFDVYNDNLGDKNKSEGAFTYNERGAEATTPLVESWLNINRNEKFFLFVHYFDPHSPYVMHEGFKYTSIPMLSTTKDHYDSEISHTDYYIGKIIKKLKDLGLYDSTLLIITSDHGEGLGEHGEKSHAYFIYHSTLHVPLIIKYPSGPKGLKVGMLAGLIDIVPTVCGSLGISVPEDVQGIDLNSYVFRAEMLDKERYVYCESLYPTKFGLGPFLGMVGNRWKYIHTSIPDLYDLTRDASEKNNLFVENNEQAILMRNMIASDLKGDNLAASINSRSDVDEETRKRLASLGYLATSSVKEDISIGQEFPNPKEHIEVFKFHEQFLSYSMSGRFDKAKKLCNKMLSDYPDLAGAYYYLGQIASYEKDADAVISNFSRYVKLSSTCNAANPFSSSPSLLSLAHNNIGIAYQQKGIINEAVEHFEKSLSYIPHRMQALLSLADCYIIQKQINLAVDCYIKALELDPEQEEVVTSLKKIAEAFNKAGYTSQAINCYKKMLIFRPNDFQTNYDLAKSAEFFEDYPLAIKHWEAVLRINSNQPDVMERLTKLYVRDPKSDYYDPERSAELYKALNKRTND